MLAKGAQSLTFCSQVQVGRRWQRHLQRLAQQCIHGADGTHNNTHIDQSMSEWTDLMTFLACTMLHRFVKLRASWGLRVLGQGSRMPSRVLAKGAQSLTFCSQVQVGRRWQRHLQRLAQQCIHGADGTHNNTHIDQSMSEWTDLMTFLACTMLHRFVKLRASWGLRVLGQGSRMPSRVLAEGAQRPHVL